MGFHGSAPGNFYSIVALGLRNLSGTRGMRNGAVFGEGVYLASKLEVAREFGDWGTRVRALVGSVCCRSVLYYNEVE